MRHLDWDVVICVQTFPPYENAYDFQKNDHFHLLSGKCDDVSFFSHPNHPPHRLLPNHPHHLAVHLVALVLYHGTIVLFLLEYIIREFQSYQGQSHHEPFVEQFSYNPHHPIIVLWLTATHEVFLQVPTSLFLQDSIASLAVFSSIPGTLWSTSWILK